MRFIHTLIIALLICILLSVTAWGYKPGPIIIRECPNCKELVLRETTLSGNTAGALIWTDGKMRAQMLPDRPWLVECWNCRTLFWIDEARQVGKAKYVRKPSVTDIYELLSASTLSKEKELYARRRAWWWANAKARNNLNPSVDYSPDEVENMLALAKLLDENDANQRITKAEIFRELGEFKACLQLLERPLGQHGDLKRANFIKKLAQEKSRAVLVIEEDIKLGVENETYEFWPDPRFEDHGDGTVTDNLTGLMWTKDTNIGIGPASWNRAVRICESCMVGGYDDWYLPRIDQLVSLVHFGQKNPALSNTTGKDQWSENDPFANPNWASAEYRRFSYWSSTSMADSEGGAWKIDMNRGNIKSSVKYNANYVWCVRGEPGPDKRFLQLRARKLLKQPVKGSSHPNKGKPWESWDQIDWLIAKLKIDNPAIRLRIVNDLSLLGKDERTVEPLINLLNDEERLIRMSAMSILADTCDRRAIIPMSENLKSTDRFVRKSAAFYFSSLAQCAYPNFTPEDKEAIIDNCVKLLKDESGPIRKKAIRTLGTVEDERVVVALTEMLETEKDPYTIKMINEILAD